MGRLTEILEAAQERAEDDGLMIQGCVLPEEAWEILQLAPGAKLVDIRAQAELDLVGWVPGATHIELYRYPGWVQSDSFVAELNQQVDPEALVMFLCRSGNRSQDAAMIAMNEGYTQVYNIIEGFEGDKDGAGHRGVGGWKKKGLPWSQN